MLTGAGEAACKALSAACCDRHDVRLRALETDGDHGHGFVSAPPRWPPATIVGGSRGTARARGGRGPPSSSASVAGDSSGLRHTSGDGGRLYGRRSFVAISRNARGNSRPSGRRLSSHPLKRMGIPAPFYNSARVTLPVSALFMPVCPVAQGRPPDRPQFSYRLPVTPRIAVVAPRDPPIRHWTNHLSTCSDSGCVVRFSGLLLGND
ncbi:hypothetical protein [Acidiferrobacter thiooxydans]|uniref:hypothetical protein n=1 Tax=Acidiferrobacter thiooxydans TaxID=163359 RepID=UPI003989E80A